MPSAWLEAGEEAIFEKLPTRFGPVTLRTKVSRDGRSLDVTFRPAWRQAPREVILHAPPTGIRTVRVNGRPASFRGGRMKLLVGE